MNVRETVTENQDNKLINSRILLLIQIITMVPFLLITRLDRSNESFINLLILPMFGYFLTIYFLKSNKLGEISLKNNEFWTYTILIRIFILFLPIGLSDDIYRYLWDGHLQQQNINPYLFSPNSEELINNRPSWWNLINNRHVPSPYPPAAQIIFFILTSFTTNLSHLIITFRIVMIFFDIAIIIVLKRLLRIYDLAENRIIIYAWSPLVLFEISGNAHIDIVSSFFLVLSIYFIIESSNKQYYQIYSGISLALAYLVKFYPIVILPFIIMKLGIKGVVSFILTVLIFTLYYFERGINPLYPEGVRSFAKDFRFNESLFRVHRYILANYFNVEKADLAARANYSVMMTIISLLCVFYFYHNYFKSNFSSDLKEYTHNSIKLYYFIIFAALLLGPDIQPWYILWLLPFSLIFFDLAVITLSVTILLSYRIYPAYDASNIWIETPFTIFAEYLIVYAIIIYQVVKRFNRKQSIQ